MLANEDEFQKVEINEIIYQINSVIGQGGAGIVYHVMDKQGNRFALKMIRSYLKNSILKQNPKSILTLAIHNPILWPNVDMYQIRIINSDIFILLQLGQYSLRNKIQMNHLIQIQYLQMLIDVSNGIYSIHNKKMIHRDIKPENVIYSKGVFKITDFGTSIEAEKTDEMVGTCLYWAPEILFGQEGEFTQALDVWSFGVLAFQAYFLIHPFFYDKSIDTPKQAIRSMKKNIQAILPNFSFEKLILHLKKSGYQIQADFIANKVKSTNQQLVNIFKDMFMLQSQKRQQIPMLLAKFQSLISFQYNKLQQVKSCKLLKIQQSLPADIQLFVLALNLFHKLTNNFHYSNHCQVQYCLELGLRFLTIKQHQGKDFVNYCLGDKITKHKQVQQGLLQDVKEGLSQYYFYLVENQDIKFFQDLPIFKHYICLCSRWMFIIQKQRLFFKKIAAITKFDIQSMQDFRQYVPAMMERQLSTIQNWIIGQYI